MTLKQNARSKSVYIRTHKYGVMANGYITTTSHVYKINAKSINYALESINMVLWLRLKYHHIPLIQNKCSVK